MPALVRVRPGEILDFTSRALDRNLRTTARSRVHAGGGGEFGMYQLQNAVGFNEYVHGRFMDPVFYAYAPADSRSMALAGPGLESRIPFSLS